MEGANGRLSVLAGHLTLEASTPSGLTQQACAAQQAVLYARPAGHGSAYGRVGSEQDAPAFARPSKYTPAEDLKLSQLSSAAAATDTWKPQVHASELVDRYEVTMPLPKAGEGMQVGGLSVSLMGRSLRISGYRVQPLDYRIHMRPDSATGRPQSGIGHVTRKDVTQDPFSIWWPLQRDCASDRIRAKRRNDKLTITVRKA